MSGTTWSKFYWSDWESDQKLRMCSAGAQGLWMRMLCVCAQSGGFLTLEGNTLGPQEMAALAGWPVAEVEAWWSELAKWGVFSVDGKGRAYSRRMVSDGKKARIARENGKNGGNPSLRKSEGKSTSVNPLPTDPSGRHQIPDTREERLSAAVQPPAVPPEAATPPPVATPAADDELDRLERRLREAAGSALNSAAPTLLILAPILGLLHPKTGEPADLEQDVLPTIRAVAAKVKPGAVRRWSYFEEAIVETRDRRLAVAGGQRRTAPIPTEKLIAWRANHYRETGEWRAEWGDRPETEAA